MKKTIAAASPDAYVAALSGWQRPLVERLRAAIRAAAPFDEVIKWRNLVYLANGPCILIRAEETRVLVGFWRGKRLIAVDERIVASGKYELGNLILRNGDTIDEADVIRLAAAAEELNAQLGDPTDVR